jgi:cysteine desulfuration protein SufE
MPLSIQEKQQELIDEFSLFDDWNDKYAHIIQLAKELPLIDDKFKTDEYKIKGCQSQVWLNAELHDGKILFTADSDAIITKGIVALMVRVFSGHSAEEINEATIDFIDEIGLREHLSPTRSNGLLAMVKQMKYYALAHKIKDMN